jgi:heme-degrading monooxygenase HmoA
MFMRITWAKLRPGGFEQHAAQHRELKRDIDGLKARWLSRDVNDPDAIFAISLWQSLEAMRSWEGSEFYTRIYLPTLRRHMEGEYTVSVCEVVNAEGLDR